MNEVYIHLLSPCPLRDTAFPRRFLQAAAALLPAVVPTRFGLVEPINTRFSLESEALFCEQWAEDLFFCSASPDSLCHAFQSYGRDHTICGLRFRTVEDASTRVMSFVADLADPFRVDYASVHAFPVGKRPPSPDDYFRELQSYHLVTFLPGIPWAACYGPPYVTLLGEAALLSSPAFAVQALASGRILCQVSPNLHDAVEDPPAFKAARSGIRAHLGEDVFLDPSHPKAPRRVPTFSFTQ